jgi:hemerythrin superfamily protein
MTIYDVLKKEHKKVRDLFRHIQREKDQEEEYITDVFNQLRQELTAHMATEEQVFYAELRTQERLQEQIIEACEEHAALRTMLVELSGMQKDNERWLAKLNVLNEMFISHIEDEENTVFKSAGSVIGREKAQLLAEAYMQAKNSHRAVTAV